MAAKSVGYADNNGAKIYYEEAGQGHPLVFVHAGVTDGRMWDDQISVFAENYRAIRFDFRGYGNSLPTEGRYAKRDDLFALLRYLKVERAYLIGCSMGGTAIMDFALEHPDMATALVMVGSGPSGLELDVSVPPKFAEAEEAEKNRDWDRFTELTAQIWFDGEGRNPDQMNQQTRALMITMYRRILELTEGKYTPEPPLKPSAADRLGDLHLPVLIIYGDRDVPYIQAVAQHMADHIIGARKVLMSNTAHLPNMERPEEFNQIIFDFLHSLQHK